MNEDSCRLPQECQCSMKPLRIRTLHPHSLFTLLLLGFFTQLCLQIPLIQFITIKQCNVIDVLLVDMESFQTNLERNFCCKLFCSIAGRCMYKEKCSCLMMTFDCCGNLMMLNQKESSILSKYITYLIKYF